MKITIAILAIFAWVLGLVLLLAPAEFYGPAGMDLDELLATLPQATGVLWIGLGVMSWFARDADRQGRLAAFAGNFTVHLLSLAIVLRTMLIGQGAVGITPAVLVHLLFAGLCAYFLVRLLQSARAAN